MDRAAIITHIGGPRRDSHRNRRGGNVLYHPYDRNEINVVSRQTTPNTDPMVIENPENIEIREKPKDSMEE